MLIVHSMRCADSKPAGHFDGIDIRSQEHELPVILLLLLLHHPLHLAIRVLSAGILHTVRRDDKQGLLRNILFLHVVMDPINVVDCPADRIQKSRTTPHIVLGIIHRLNLADILPVVKHLRQVIEQDDRYIGLSVFPSLLLKKTIETTDRIRLQPGHRPAPVKDKYKLCGICLHTDLTF